MTKSEFRTAKSTIQAGLIVSELKQVGHPNLGPINVLFLANIPETALTALIGKAKTVTYIRTETFGTEAIKANYCFIILFGTAQAFIGKDGNTRKVVCQVQETRAGYGEMAVLSDVLLSDSVVILDKALFAVVPKRDVKNWVMNSPEIKSTLL